LTVNETLKVDGKTFHQCKCGVYIQEDAPHVHMTAKERRLGKQVEHDLMGVIEGK